MGRLTALCSRLSSRTSSLAPRRRPSFSPFDTRLRVVKSGTTTVVETTRCALCARSRPSQQWWQRRRSRRRLPTLMTSRSCDTSLRRSSNSVDHPTQSAAFLLSTRVVDGGHHLRHRPLHRGRLLRASSRKHPLLHDTTLQRRCVHPGALLRRHQPPRTHGQTPIPLLYRTQCHGRTHRSHGPLAVRHAMPVIVHFSSPSVIRIRMMRSHIRHPFTAAVRALDRVIIHVVGLSSFRMRQA